ncbi:MAG: sigma-54-dependent transcriptional regulator [Desulfobacterales bacterium]
MAGRILIVDDEKDMLVLLERILREETPHEVVTASDPEAAIDLFRESPFDLVLTDLKMPKMDGIQLFEALRRLSPDVPVVVMTAYATIETAVETIRKGAYDYITKPFRRERILLTVNKVMEWNTVVRENRELRKVLDQSSSLSALVGSSPVMQEIRQRIRQVAPTTGTVLITGPSGTGKELVARAIHDNSLRFNHRMVTVNCTAIPEQVMESELFGHVKGAFTGAWKDKKGLVEVAHEGTLFLDEIGDMPNHLQTKLLRLIQEGEFKPVGSVATRKADLRIIAATNHELRQDIREKRFREDLYYRLNVIRFDLPPLKERREDILPLCYHFLRKYNAMNGKAIRALSTSAQQALSSGDFPGNVRELENIIERGVILCRSDTLTLEDLSLETEEDSIISDDLPDLGQMDFREAKDRMIQAFHSRYIQILLKESGGNISRAADIAGIQRQYLHRLMKETGIDAEEFKHRG